MNRYFTREPRTPGISKIAELMSTPISVQEMDKFRKEVKDIVGGPGTAFNFDKYGQASAKLVRLCEKFDEIEARFGRRLGGEKLKQTVAASLLSQMAHGDTWGTLSKPLFALSLVPSYIERTNLIIARYIAPADLQFYLCDYESKDGKDKSIIKTGESCEKKLDYIMALYRMIHNNTKSEFVFSNYTETQKILIRAAVGQLQYMKNEEGKEGSKVYSHYVDALAKEFGFDKPQIGLFVISMDLLNRQLDQS